MGLFEDTESKRIPTLEETPGAMSRANIEQNTYAIMRREDEARQRLEDHKVSLMEGLTGSFKYETWTGIGISTAQDLVQKVDDTFNVKEQLTADVEEKGYRPEWETSILQGAVSKEHWAVLEERIAGKKEFMLNAQDMGLAGSMGLQMVAEFANIPNYFSFGLAGLAKARKIKRFLVSGAVMGTANMVEEAVINTMYNDRTTTDYIVAGTLGGGLGWLGTLGGSAKMALHIDDVSENFSKTHMKNSVDEALEGVLGTGIEVKGTVGAMEAKGVHETLAPDFDHTKGSPETDPTNPTVQAAYEDAITGNLPQAKKYVHEKAALTSMSQSLHSSDNMVARHMVKEMLEHPESTQKWNDSTAALEADLDFQFFAANYTPRYTRLSSAWEVLKEQGMQVKHSFDEAAHIYMETGKSVQGSNKAMDKVLEEFAPVYRERNNYMYELGKDSGVPEFSKGELDPNHVGRGWDGEAMLNAKNKYGQNAVVETLQESIIKGNEFKTAHAKADKIHAEKVKAATDIHDAKIKKIEDDIKALKYDKGDVSPAGLRKGVKLEKLLKKLEDIKKDVPDIPKKMPPIEKMALRMAQAFYHRFLNRSISTTADANLLSSANRTALMDALKDLNTTGKMDAEDMLHITSVLDTMGKDRVANPTKHQTGMDVSYEHVSGLRILDMMHTDLSSAFASQHRYWLGRAALARHGFPTEQAFQAAIDQVGKHGLDIGQSAKAIKADKIRLEGGWKMILGQPVEDMDAFGNALMRQTRKAMAVASLGKLGIVQAGENGRVMSAAGIPNIIEGIPFIKNMITDVFNGNLDTPMLRNMEEAILGKIGADHYMNHPQFRADDFGHKISKAEQQLDRMGFWLSKKSGWHMVHTQQKKILMNHLGHKWYREFTEGTLSPHRFKDLGIPIEQFDGLKADMLKYAEFNDRGILQSLHLEQWEPNNRRAMGFALHRKSANAIQDIIAGETPLWMNRGLGKFLAQFRTFSVAALGKQTIHDWQMYKQGDKEAALAFQFMLATSTMAITARMAFDAMALPAKDRQEYLKRNVNIRNITKRILGYHGQLSPLVDATEFLMSSVAPNTWGQLTGTSQYRNGRGLTSKIPGLAYADKAYKGVTGVAKGILPGETMSKSDWNAWVGVLPYSTWYGSHILNKRVVTPLLFD